MMPPSNGRGEGCLAFVESNMTGTGMQAIHLAGQMGLRTVFVTSDPDRYSTDPKMEETLRTRVDRILECDTQNPIAVEKVLRDQVDHLVGVMTVMEYYVPTAAAVAERLGLPGISAHSAHTARSKLLTRKACAERSVPVPAYRFVDDPADLDAALEAVGLPCVIKPSDESASIGVTLCHTREQALERIRELCATRVNSKGQARVPGGLVEECLFGHEVSVETFTHAGQTVVLGVTDKQLGPTPHFIELGHTFPSMLPAHRTSPAVQVAVAALEAVGFDFGPAHVEIKLTERGPVLIEINARAGGDLIPDLVEHAVGVPLMKETIVAVTGGTPKLEPCWHRGAAIRFVTGRSGAVRSIGGEEIPTWFPSVVGFRMKAEAGKETRWPTNSHDRIGYVLATADSPAEAAAEAEAARAHLTVTY